MSGRHKVIARRHETAATRTTDSGRSTARMPEDLVSDQVRRLAVFAATAGAVWSFGLFMDFIVLPAAGQPDTPNWRTISIEIYACLTALAMWAYMRVSTSPHHVKMNAGLVFMVMNALAIALLNAWALPPDIRDRLWPFLGDSPAPPAGRARSREEILADLLRSNESIVLNLEELRRRAATGSGSP